MAFSGRREDHWRSSILCGTGRVWATLLQPSHSPFEAWRSEDQGETLVLTFGNGFGGFVGDDCERLPVGPGAFPSYPVADCQFVSTHLVR